jgi:4-amino-4-deoxy-L-arabinose transferase-like glycosyltransferase
VYYQFTESMPNPPPNPLFAVEDVNSAAEPGPLPQEEKRGSSTGAPIPARRFGRLEVAFWLLAIVLGFFHAWANHHELKNTDAMSYLDIAEAYLRADWQAAINSYWSPLYSWLIAFALLITNPATYWKFAVVHLVNFANYLFALGCFTFLMRELVHRQQTPGAENLLPLRDRALTALGYSLFIWSSLFLVTIQLESPDMLVAGFVYLAAAILLRLRRQHSDWIWFPVLGIVLGLGYLAKSVMLPMALVFIGASFFSVGGLRRAVPRAALTVAFFLLVAGPFIFAISRAKGRWTTGESGSLNYLWSINRVTNTHWQGEEPGSGQPRHPTRKIFADPPAFEFSQPVAGTYPPWYDATYWYEGSVSHFDGRQQLRVMLAGVKAYYELFHSWSIQYGLLVALLVLYLMGRRGRLLIRDVVEQWPLIVPAIAGMGLYLLVHVQGRYVASFIVLLWLALFSAVRPSNTPESRRLLKSIAVALVAGILFITIASSSQEVIRSVRQLAAGEEPSAHEHWQVAEGLREKGIAPGHQVAFIGHSHRAFWAHLLKLRIVSEIKREQVHRFWESDPSVQSKVLDAFARTGAKAVVAENVPLSTDLSGWHRIRDTNYYVYLLN